MGLVSWAIRGLSQLRPARAAERFFLNENSGRDSAASGLLLLNGLATEATVEDSTIVINGLTKLLAAA